MGSHVGIVGQADYIPVWVCAVVGVHLLPLAPLLRDRRLVPLGMLVTIVALAALAAGLTQTATPSTVTGAGAGLLLLGFAIAELAAALSYHHRHGVRRGPRRAHP